MIESPAQLQTRWPAAMASNMTVMRADDAPTLEALWGARSECVQLSPGRFSAQAVQLHADAVRVFSFSSNRGLQIRRWIAPDTIAVAYITRASTKVLEHARTWTPDEFLIVSGNEVDISSLDALDMAWLEVDAAALETKPHRGLLDSLRGSSKLVSLKVDPHADMRALVAAALSIPGLEDTVLRRIQHVVGVEQHTAPQRPLRKEYDLVRRAERIMWSKGEEPMTLQYLCANTGCGARSLIYAFKAWSGMGPMRYLKTLRLNAVRRRLLETQGRERIFDVAVDFGFWHMGHFTADYKRMFGLTASETLDAARAASRIPIGKMGSGLRLSPRDGESC